MSKTTTDSRLYTKITQRTAKVGVVGLGYVGLPTVVSAASAGFCVTGIDINSIRVEQVNEGSSYIEDVSSATLSQLVQEGKFTATTDYSVLRDLDVIVVCVPTPIDKHKEPDLGPLQVTVQALAQHLRTQQLIVLQSTSFPGTTEEMVLPQLQKTGLLAGRDFYLAFSPERIDPGNRQYSIQNIPKVVGGVTVDCGTLAAAFLSCLVEQVITVSSPKVAETSKLLENIFRSVNIALVNELSEACHRMGIDIWEVVQAAATKPFGFMPFLPGIGVGGHCIPVDPFYLSWKAKEHDCYVDFIELAAKTNDNRPHFVVSRIVDILASQGLLLSESSILLLGVSFKKDIKDTRNSPALRVAELLSEKGCRLSYCDPHVPEVTIGGRTQKSVEVSQESLRHYAASIILVGHSYFDLDLIVGHSKLVIDAVDATRPLGARPTVFKL